MASPDMLKKPLLNFTADIIGQWRFELTTLSPDQEDFQLRRGQHLPLDKLACSWPTP